MEKDMGTQQHRNYQNNSKAEILLLKVYYEPLNTILYDLSSL